MRRLVVMLAVAVVWAGAGSALLPSRAAAGGVDDRGRLTAALYNYTPYTWTKVDERAPTPCPYLDPTGANRCWAGPLPQTISPGQTPVYSLDPNDDESAPFSAKFGYDASVTYRVDVLGGGPPEYVTLAISQCQCSGFYGSSIASVVLWNTLAPPPPSWDPATLTPPATSVPNPQLGAVPGPQLFDVTVTASGNFNVDASTDLGRPFVDLLNSACAGADNTSCSFTQTAPITYGPGQLGGRHNAQNCDLNGNPDDEPDYIAVEYTAAQSASLSVGGGVTASAEFSLFGTISSEASVSVEAEHEWEEVKTITRETRVYIPANSLGFAWAAPTVGRIKGTLVAQIGKATYTAVNFTEVRNGVSGVTDPRTEPIPAFNVVATTRPMTEKELEFFCGKKPPTARLLKERRAAPPAGLQAGRSIGRVALGESQEAVYARLGEPTERRFQVQPCAGMPGCVAAAGMGGTWSYPKRKLSVVFGPDRSVVALIHSGTPSTTGGVGKDATLAAVRANFPGIACAKNGSRIDCSAKQVSGSKTTRTVFRFGERRGHRWKTNKVLMYVDGRGQVSR